MSSRQVPQEIVDQLVALWRDQKTGSEIAAALGMTRNAVMGMLNRLRVKGKLGYRKLQFLGKDTKPRRSRANAPKAKTTVSVDKPGVSTGPNPHLVVWPKRPEPVFTPGPDKGVKLEDLEYWHCRWAMSEVRPKVFRFCGARKKDGSSYCTEHHALVYVPRAKTAPKPPSDQPSRPISTWRAMQ